MIISELIRELEKYNPDAEITTPYSETIRLGFICRDPKGEATYDESTTPYVFIEGCDFIEEDD